LKQMMKRIRGWHLPRCMNERVGKAVKQGPVPGTIQVNVEIRYPKHSVMVTIRLKVFNCPALECFTVIG